MIPLYGSEIHGTGTTPQSLTARSLRKNTGPSRKGLSRLSLPAFFEGLSLLNFARYTSYEILFDEWLSRVMIYKLHMTMGFT